MSARERERTIEALADLLDLDPRDLASLTDEELRALALEAWEGEEEREP